MAWSIRIFAKESIPPNIIICEFGMRKWLKKNVGVESFFITLYMKSVSDRGTCLSENAFFNRK